MDLSEHPQDVAITRENRNWLWGGLALVGLFIAALVVLLTLANSSSGSYDEDGWYRPADGHYYRGGDDLSKDYNPLPGFNTNR